MPTAAPSGTVTFLFTDVEASTTAWERDADTTGRALARHDRIARAVFDAHGGRVFSNAGDAFAVAFGRAADAVRAALDLQRGLADETGLDDPIATRVRVAIHSGEAEEREGNYFGRPLNRAARILALGHGGQVLVSGATATLARESLPAESSLRDLGEHRLRDLERPEHVHQLLHPALRASFPPLRSLDAALHNLPLQLTSLVGREGELETVTGFLGQHRLVTLTGAGGSGKTRLALHTAAAAVDTFPDGVWLVELAPLADPEQVPRTVAAALGLRDSPDRSIEETLEAYLRARTLLLVLDNCEHLIESCARFANEALRGAAGLRILATSREGLGVPGELVWLVPSLSLPDGRSGGEGVDASEAVRLFVERARLVQPTFTLTPANADAVGRVCQRLDGIPLAIELAAARARVLTPDQIATRLDDRFRLLAGGTRTALPRHQTLRAAIDWSWDHLDEEEKALCRRLAVFAGGWTLEAAEGVGAEGLVGDVLDLLGRLVDKSVVAVDASGDEARYRMLETVRQYALDRLLDAGETGAARDRHLDWFADQYRDAEKALQGIDPGPWMDRMEADLDNLRAALEWGFGSEGGCATALRLAAATGVFWLRRGYLHEGIDWLHRGLGSGAADPASRVQGLRQLSQLLGYAGFEGSQQAGAEAVAIAREIDDDHELLAALTSEAIAYLRRADPAARPLLDEADALARRMGGAGESFLSRIRTNLGEFERLRGNLEAAERCYREALDLDARTGHRAQDDIVLFNLGQIALARGDAAGALARYHEALARARQIGRLSMLGWGVVGVGQVLAARGDLVRATRLFAAAQTSQEKAGIVMDQSDRPLYDVALTRAREGLAPEVYEAAWAEGRSLPVERAVEEALAVE